jgi:hypothetical protein
MRIAGFLGLACPVILLAAEACAACCPYCGRRYGEGSSRDSAYISRIRAAHEANCPARRRRSTTTSSPRTATTYRRGPSAAELAARRRRARGHALNEQGCAYYKKKDWASAAKCFEQATRLKPGSAVIKRNLANARRQLRYENERKLREWRARRAEEQAKRKVEKILDEASRELGPGSQTPAGDLSFDAAAREVYDGAKPAGDASVVDLRDKDPDKLTVDPARVRGSGAQPGDSGLGFGALTEPPVPGKPGPAEKKDSARRSGRPSARIRGLSDKALEDELARMRRTFVKMKGEFQADVKSLQQWARESREAQRQAIKESADQLLGLLKSKVGEQILKNDPREARKLMEAARKLQKDLSKTGLDFATSSGDGQARLEAARASLQSSYEYLSEVSDKFTRSGNQYTALGNYLVNYSYQATRWEISRRQIKMIHDNLDGPGGKLEAQKALRAYHQKLMKEHNRRKALKQ